MVVVSKWRDGVPEPQIAAPARWFRGIDAAQRRNSGNA
jgi:hypothetical protein